MIVSLYGKFLGVNPTYIIVETYGVGYGVHIPLSTHSAIAGQSEGRLWIWQVLGEDKDVLYGFHTTEEREMFGLLLSVSGVGGSTALLMLSSMSVPDLQAAIANGQESVLVKLKGVGPKTAKQVIVDLKDKMPKLDPLKTETENPAADGAVEALVQLGFQKTVAKKAVADVVSQGVEDLNEIVRKCLQILSR